MELRAIIEPSTTQRRTSPRMCNMKNENAEQPAPVQGWKLVPVEPTQKMLDAPPNAYPADALVTWKAMLAATPQPAVQQEPVAFYVYKPTLPLGHLGTVSDGDLPWVYDQDPSSGFSARMLVAPVTSPPARQQEPVAQCMEHGECFGGKCIYPAPQPAQQEQCPTCGEFEPRTGTCGTSFDDLRALCNRAAPQPAQRKPLTGWIDPNDKTQKQYLPHIGEPILFCHGGKTYIGKHNGGSFQTEVDYANYFNTWECHWMRLPAAHNIKEQP